MNQEKNLCYVIAVVKRQWQIEHINCYIIKSFFSNEEDIMRKELIVGKLSPKKLKLGKIKACVPYWNRNKYLIFPNFVNKFIQQFSSEISVVVLIIRQTVLWNIRI